jgi:hypothetical protein
VPAVPTALEAREPVRGHANARQTVLARAVIASDTRRIADPPRLKFLSRIPQAPMLLQLVDATPTWRLLVRPSFVSYVVEWLADAMEGA